MTWRCGAGLVLMLALTLAACGPKPPLRIGFLGGRASEGFSVSGEARNGAHLAIAEINRLGGVQGRALELLVREVSHDAASAQAMAGELLSEGVEAVVGPFTSTLALAVLSQAEVAKTLLISPTANAPELAQRDDHLVGLNGTVADAARAYAEVLTRHGQRRLAVAFDESNRAYSRPWVESLRAGLAARGAEVVAQAGFVPGPELSYASTVRSLLAAAPDGLLFIGKGSDVAALAQQARRQGATLPLATAGWGATDSLIERGGRAVEGLVTAKPYDPASGSSRYQAFRAQYLERHAREPSFGALGGHDAVTVLAAAMACATRGETLKEAVLRCGPYEGLQHAIAFDRFGDSQRPLHFVVVRDGAFKALQVAGR